MNNELLVVLLVEDNPDHAELVMRSFAEHDLNCLVKHVADGEIALNYLFRRGEWADPEKSPRPHVILLDLRLPKVDGLEVLKEIKKVEELRRIPVVVLTTSAAEMDIARAYDNYVNSYLVKPVEFDAFIRLMGDLGFYWLVWNRPV